MKTVRGVLRPAFQMAVDDDVLYKNPFGFELAGVVVNDSVTREALTRDQMRKFLNTNGGASAALSALVWARREHKTQRECAITAMESITPSLMARYFMSWPPISMTAVTPGLTISVCIVINFSSIQVNEPNKFVL